MASMKRFVSVLKKPFIYIYEMFGSVISYRIIENLGFP